MGKKKVPTVHSAAKPDKLRKVMEAINTLSASNKAKWAKLNKAQLLAFIVLSVVMSLLTFGAHAGIFAALYLFANDGKVSGRQSGSVKTRNGIERMFVVPRLVQNAYTAGARALLSLYSSLWASLTQDNRDSWNNVTNVFKSNRFGVSVPVKGKALFIQRNANLTNIGEPAITDYVTGDGVSSSILTGGTATTAAGSLTVLTTTFAPTPSDGGTSHKVYATAPLGAGISRPSSSAFRLIVVMSASQASPFNILTAYTTKFGASASPGLNIFIKFEAVNQTTGQAAAPSIVLLTTT